MLRKIFLFVILLLLAVPAFAVVTTSITPVELGATPIVDSTVAAASRFLTYRVPMTSDSALSFVNDDRTFIVLFDSSGASATTTIPKPQATIVTPWGTLSLSDITIPTVSSLGNFALIHIPTRFNIAGKISIYTSSGDYINISVFRLAKFEQ